MNLLKQHIIVQDQDGQNNNMKNKHLRAEAKVQIYNFLTTETSGEIKVLTITNKAISDANKKNRARSPTDNTMDAKLEVKWKPYVNQMDKHRVVKISHDNILTRRLTLQHYKGITVTVTNIG